ncbi:hypothetical protein BC360_17420 [Ensifer sp. LC163]|nr:hypothetical protein BC360_17420 [Ensifer sp. LC163]
MSKAPGDVPPWKPNASAVDAPHSRQSKPFPAGPAPIASEALRRIAELYRNEDEIRGRTQDERRALRQEKSRPITDSLAPWLREQLGLISQKTKLAAWPRATGDARMIVSRCLVL